MVKKEIKVIAGFEKPYDELVEMRNNLEEEVRRMVAEKAERIDKTIALITEEVEVEVPDEVEETCEEVNVTPEENTENLTTNNY